MWGRRTSRDSDAAAAARRRLAAIAAEFDRGPLPDAGSPLAPSSPAPAAPSSPSVGSEGGRHRAGTGTRPWGRWRLTVQHVAILALAAVALVALAAWWALRAVPHPEPVPLATSRSGTAAAMPPPTSPGTPSASTPTGGVPASNAATPSGIVIDVTGKVRRPGIVELPSGSRVVDALKAAGGARPGVDTAGLNLARPLVDGEQIVVGLAVPAVAPPASSAGTSTAGPAPASVDLNTASEAELDTLPGIGPVTAQAILDWRSENGAFTSVDELLDVSGIGDATLADIEPYVHV
jgi:competence protein ComEA